MPKKPTPSAPAPVSSKKKAAGKTPAAPPAVKAVAGGGKSRRPTQAPAPSANAAPPSRPTPAPSPARSRSPAAPSRSGAPSRATSRADVLASSRAPTPTRAPSLTDTSANSELFLPRSAIPTISNLAKAAQGSAPRKGRAPVAPAAERPAGRESLPTGALRIYQIHYEPSQRQALDNAFVALDNAGQQDLLHEFAVFERLAASPSTRGLPLWGAVSWKFTEKTGLSGADFIQAIQAQPGYDLYYCNPNLEAEGLFGNFWQQGMTTHPAFKELSEAFLKVSGLNPECLHRVEPSNTFSSCNYFVGTDRFWSTYLPFVRRCVESARTGLTPAFLKVMDSSLSDPRKVHQGSSYWPFIIERLLPEYLRGPGEGLKTFKVPLPAVEARLNIHQRRLREMKDVAHRTRSTWLHNCWLNYRNLYLLETAGRDWCKRYLPLFNTATVQFA